MAALPNLFSRRSMKRAERGERRVGSQGCCKRDAPRVLQLVVAKVEGRHGAVRQCIRQRGHRYSRVLAIPHAARQLLLAAQVVAGQVEIAQRRIRAQRPCQRHATGGADTAVGQAQRREHGVRCQRRRKRTRALLANGRANQRQARHAAVRAQAVGEGACTVRTEAADQAELSQRGVSAEGASKSGEARGAHAKVVVALSDVQLELGHARLAHEVRDSDNRRGAIEKRLELRYLLPPAG
eukprot:scaffold64350_cov68-Phaeocystis_antarctica.AAC.3